MAQQKIVLAELDIDIKSLIAASQEAVEALKKINKELKSLKESGQESSAQFIKMQADMQQLTDTIEAQTKAIKEQAKKNEDLAESQKDVTKALKKTMDAQEEYNEAIEESISLAEDYTDALDEFNEAMEESVELAQDYADGADDAAQATKDLNKELKDNERLMESSADSTEKQAKTFNDYKDQIAESFNSINIFNGGIGGFISRAQEAGGMGPLLQNAFTGITGGIKGMGQAIASNPLGVLLMVLGPIIEQLKNFAPLTNAIEQAMAGLSPVIDLATKPIKWLAEGITMVISGFTSLMGAFSSTANEAIKLKAAEQELAVQMERQESANERAKQQTDELIKKSQDHTLSEQERAKALDDATKVQKKNYDERKAFADSAYNIELQKLAQSKSLSAQEMAILQEGSDAAVQKLMNDKNITTDELAALEETKVEKMRIAAEETDMKQEQADAVKELADELIEKSEDESLSVQDRIKALEEAGSIEEKYYANRKQEADAQYNNLKAGAALRQGITQQDLDNLFKEGESYAGKARLVAILGQQEVDALIAAGNEKQRLSREEIARNEGIETARQKIYSDDAARQKEANQKKLEGALETQKQLLELFIAEGDIHAKTLQEQLKFEDDKCKKSVALLKKELELKKISLNEYKAAALEIENKKLENIAKINVASAKAQLDLWKEQHQSKLNDSKTVTDTEIKQEKVRLGHIYKENLKMLETEKGFNAEKIADIVAKNGTLTTDQAAFYTNALKLKREHDAEIIATDKILADATAAAEAQGAADKTKKEQDDKTAKQLKRDTETADRALDYEVKIAEADTQYEAQMLQEELRYQNAKAALVARAEEEHLTKEQFASLDKALDDETHKNKQKLAIQSMQTQLGAMQSIAGALSDAFGQNKEMAIAQATMNAGQAILSIWAGQITGNPIIDTVIKGVLTAATAVKTVKQIKEIQSAKKPKQPKFAQGGLMPVGGSRHSAGGTLFTGADGTRFEAEQGELIGVMNRNAAAHFMAFNNAFPAGGSSAPNYFASGGIVSREIAAPSLNTDELAAKIAQANRAMPAPVVAVQDIITQGNSYVQVRDAANF